MSKRAYDKFQRALSDDPQLAQKLRERIAEAGETNAVDTTVAFARRHGFEIDACACMTDAELEAALADPGIVRARGKVWAVRSNAQATQRIQQEFGSLDAYLWGFVDGRQLVGEWASMEQVPTQTELSRTVSADLKHR